MSTRRVAHTVVNYRTRSVQSRALHVIARMIRNRNLQPMTDATAYALDTIALRLERGDRLGARDLYAALPAVTQSIVEDISESLKLLRNSNAS